MSLLLVLLSLIIDAAGSSSTMKDAIVGKRAHQTLN